MQRVFVLLLASLALAFGSVAAQASSSTDKRLEESRKVFESFSFLTEQAIPTWLLERAYGVVVVPRVIEGALGFGGRFGNGVMSVRNPDGSWSNTVFVRLAGRNVGFQIGVQSTDLVLVLMSRKSVEGIAGGKVTLGADASVAAGPLGRSATAATDATLSAQILAYARNEGIFAGVSIDGSVIAIDDKANASAYGVSGILASQILEGKAAKVPPAAAAFSASLARATAAPSAAAPAPAGTAAPASAPTPPPAPQDGEAKTYPMGPGAGRTSTAVALDRRPSTPDRGAHGGSRGEGTQGVVLRGGGAHRPAARGRPDPADHGARRALDHHQRQHGDRLRDRERLRPVQRMVGG